MNHEKLAKALLDRLAYLGVNLREMPLQYLDEVCRGRSMIVVARKLKCKDCGCRHRTGCGLLPASKVHPIELFQK